MATETVIATTKERSSQVRVHLKTNDDELQLPSDIGPILVSTDLRRLQLSTLVNKLLETGQPVPLEFLINGQFLRTTIDEFLTQNGISAETTLSVEYVRALIPPLPVASYEHDDWISSVDILSNTSNPWTWQKRSAEAPIQARLLTGAFDGALRVWNSSAEVIATGKSHAGPIKDVKFISPSKIVSAGTDRLVKVWKFVDAETPGQSASLEPSLELYGHTDSVDAVAVHGPSNRILSASADHKIGIWSTQKSSLPPAPEDLLTSNKRRKLSHPAKSLPQRGASSMLSGHHAQVSAVCFDDKDQTVAYSGAWDHSIKTWDLTTSKCVDTRTISQSIFSLAHLPQASLIAAGTSARHITMVDPRASATTIAAMTLRGHSNAISSIAVDPDSTYQLVSGSHDGTCRIWDIRSVRNEATGRGADAVYVIERESVKAGNKSKLSGDGIKVFGVAWDSEVGIVSAGEDKRAQINKAG